MFKRKFYTLQPINDSKEPVIRSDDEKHRPEIHRLPPGQGGSAGRLLIEDEEIGRRRFKLRRG